MFGSIDWSADPETISEPLEDLLNDPEVYRIWKHQLAKQGRNHYSWYDLELAYSAFCHGWSATNVYLLIRRHRLEHNDTSGEATCNDYILDTLSEAYIRYNNDDDQRVRIECEPGTNGSTCERIADALAAATALNPLHGIYQYRNELVELAFDPLGRPNPDDKAVRGARIIRRLDAAALEHRIEQHCCFFQHSLKFETHVFIDVPPKAIKWMLSMPDIWTQIPLLNGLVSSPILRSDGTILSQPGYDPETGLVFDPEGVDFHVNPHVNQGTTSAKHWSSIARSSRNSYRRRDE